MDNNNGPLPYNTINYNNSINMPFSKFDKDRPMVYDYEMSNYLRDNLLKYLPCFKFK